MHGRLHLVSTSLVLLLLSFVVVGSASAQACSCASACKYDDVECIQGCNTRCQIGEETGRAVGNYIDEMKKEKLLLDSMRASTWFGAVAEAPDHQIFAVTLEKSRESARQLALKQCAQKSPGGACRVIRELKNQCAAAAAGKGTERFVSLGEPGGSEETSGKAALLACGQKSADCKLVLLVCSTGDAAVAKYREEQRAESQPTIDAINKIVAPLWQQPRHSVLPEGGLSGTLPLIKSAVYPVGAATAPLLLSGNSLPADGPALIAGGPNLRSLVADRMSNQSFLLCEYDREANRNLTFAFWYQAAPSNIEELMSMDVMRDFIYVGNNSFSQCPATYGEASAARRAAVRYTGSPRFAEIGKGYRASKDAQGAAAPGQTVESLRIAAQAQQPTPVPASYAPEDRTPARPEPASSTNPAVQPAVEDPRQRQCTQMWKNVETARARASGLREMIGVKSMESSVRRQCGDPKKSM